MTDAQNLRKALSSPDKIAEAGERIYAERYKAELEATASGKFVAIDVTTGNATVDALPELALQQARGAAPNGVFHLIRVGSPGAFKVSYGARTSWASGLGTSTK